MTSHEYVGDIGVDSGSVMIVDPCYLNDPSRWNPEKMLEGAKREREEGNENRADNLERLAQEKLQIKNLIFDWDQFCKDSEEENYQPRQYASGIITPTYQGDGGYPVFVEKDSEGRVLRMEIIFHDPEYDTE